MPPPNRSTTSRSAFPNHFLGTGRRSLNATGNITSKRRHGLFMRRLPDEGERKVLVRQCLEGRLRNDDLAGAQETHGEVAGQEADGFILRVDIRKLDDYHSNSFRPLRR